MPTSLTSADTANQVLPVESRLGPVHLAVTDAERAREFWTRVVGLTELASGDGSITGRPSRLTEYCTPSPFAAIARVSSTFPSGEGRLIVPGCWAATRSGKPITANNATERTRANRCMAIYSGTRKSGMLFVRRP